MTHLVIGSEGEVGKALVSILKCDGHDPNKGVFAEASKAYDVIHIAIPWSDHFERSVGMYKNTFDPSLIIIHSTVPVGTSRKLGAVHSPVRGTHPDLEKGIRTFVKFFGGVGAEDMASVFRDLGVSVQVVENSEDTEAGKLVDTFQYGVFIALSKAIWAYCNERGVDFDVVYKMFMRVITVVTWRLAGQRSYGRS